MFDFLVAYRYSVLLLVSRSRRRTEEDGGESLSLSSSSGASVTERASAAVRLSSSCRLVTGSRGGEGFSSISYQCMCRGINSFKVLPF